MTNDAGERVLTNDELRRARHRVWAGIIGLILSIFVMAGVTYFLVSYKVAQSEQKWCQILGSLNDAYAKNPPTTPAGIQFAGQMRQLYHDYNCHR